MEATGLGDDMSHYDEVAPAGDRKGVVKLWLVVAGLTIAGGLSLFHLVGEYRAAAPWREARAAEYARTREASEAADARWREDYKKAEAARRAAQAPSQPSPPIERPVEWVKPPEWPTLNTYHLPEGVERASVQFQCQVNAEGVLSGCVGVEAPTNTGLADRLLPALTEARMKPMLTDGRALSGTVSFSVHFSAQAPAAGETVEDAREISPAT
jgi:hypothetical protein